MDIRSTILCKVANGQTNKQLKHNLLDVGNYWFRDSGDLCNTLLITDAQSVRF